MVMTQLLLLRRAPAMAATSTRALSTHVSVIGASVGSYSSSVITASLTLATVGLHWKTDETRLRQAFEGFGTLEKGAAARRMSAHAMTGTDALRAAAEVLKPEHSSTHLWASLVYARFDEALEAASEMNGQELDGRLLRVSIVDAPSSAAKDGGAAEQR